MTKPIPSATMRTVSMTDIRSLLPYLLTQLKSAGTNATPTVIRRHLEPMAVLISFEQFEDYRSLSAYRARELERERRREGRRSEGT